MIGNFEQNTNISETASSGATQTEVPMQAVTAGVGTEENLAERVIKIHSFQQVPVRLDDLKLKSLSAFLDYLASLNAGGIGFDIKVLINPYVLRNINMNREVESLGDLSNEDFSPEKLEQTRSWLVWFLRGAKDAVSSVSVPPEIKELESLTLFYEVEDPTILQNFMVAFHRLAMGITEEKLVQACRTEKAIIKKILKNFKDIANKNKGTQMKRLCEELEMGIDGLDTFEKFQRKILVLHKRYWESVTMAMSLGYVSVFNRPLWRKHKELNHEINRAKMEHDCTAGADEFVPKRARFDHGGQAMSQSMGGKPPATAPTATNCTGCGRLHRGGAAQCNFKTHPNFNKTGIPWKDTRMGKLWAEKGCFKLPKSRAIVNGSEVPWHAKNEQAPPKEESKGKFGGK